MKILPNAPGIYAIENIITRMLYIGQSQNVYMRVMTHQQSLRRGTHYNKGLQKDWNEYTEESFVFKLLEHCPVGRLTEREQYYVSAYGNNVYNVAPCITPSRGKSAKDQFVHIYRDVLNARVGERLFYANLTESQKHTIRVNLYNNAKSGLYGRNIKITTNSAVDIISNYEHIEGIMIVKIRVCSQIMTNGHGVKSKILYVEKVLK